MLPPLPFRPLTTLPMLPLLCQAHVPDLTAVLVGGIPGSGKSLLCQALVNLLGGQHLSQDEVEAKYSGQQNVMPFHFFLQLVESTASCPSVKYLFADSKLAKRSTREEISAAVACGFAQRNIRAGLDEAASLNLVMLTLTAGGTDIQELCATRIVQRSLRHVALIPQAAHEKVILDAMCKDVEPITPEEECNFDVCKAIDMTLPVAGLVNSALEVLPCGGYTADQVSSAIKVAQKIEKDLSLRWTTLYWKVEILEETDLQTNLAPWLSEACSSIQERHPVVQQLEDLHVTVLWTGSDADAEQKLLEFEGREVEVVITSLCCDAELGLVAVRVTLDQNLEPLCENPDPHITVAKIPGVAAKQANGVLLRQRNGDTSVVQRILPSPLRLKGLVQRQLSVEAMAASTAALAATLPEGNPLCELGLSSSRKSMDILATPSGPSFSWEGVPHPCTISQPLQHCRWPPRIGKVWFTIHQQPLSEESRLMLEGLEDKMFESLEVAVSYVYVAENLLQKTFPKLLSDLEQRMSGRCIEALLHAFQCLQAWRPRSDRSDRSDRSPPSRLA